MSTIIQPHRPLPDDQLALTLPGPPDRIQALAGCWTAAGEGA